VAWDALVSGRSHWLKDGLVKVLVRIGHRPIPGLEKVPTLSDLGRSAEDRAMLELALVPSEIGMALSAPPGVPAERLAALRRAFDLTMKDPDFLAATKKRQVPVVPMSGEALERLIAQGLSTPQPVVLRMNKLIAGL
jgi:tripartite-type tricarboxylate transporter receptor subunit TctC